jgi:hypothetical protein
MVLWASNFAIAFANAVTVSSSHEYDWVARSGIYNIYNLLYQLCPTVTNEALNLHLLCILSSLHCAGTSVGLQVAPSLLIWQLLVVSYTSDLLYFQKRHHQPFEDFQSSIGLSRLHESASSDPMHREVHPLV